ncbi:MAG: sarcosine oxidase subunit gamma [Alphaproteobacteria bacterium]
MSSPVSYSPLQGLAGTTGLNVKLKELDRFNFTLRGEANNKKFVTAIEKVIGKLPTNPNTTTTKGDITVIWQSPNEWVLTGSYSKSEKVFNDIEKALKGIHSALVDVSDYYMSLNISGKKVRSVLEKGCIIDLDPDVFKIGTATGTRYEKAVINLHRESADSYNIIFRRSFAPYLWGHLTHGSREFK